MERDSGSSANEAGSGSAVTADGSHGGTRPHAGTTDHDQTDAPTRQDANGHADPASATPGTQPLPVWVASETTAPAEREVDPAEAEPSGTDAEPSVTDAEQSVTDADAVATGSRPLGGGTSAPLFEPIEARPRTLPTGPVPIADTRPDEPAGAFPVRVLLQGVIVLVAAALVGLAVFAAIRATVDSSDTEEAVVDEEGEAVVTPGPGDPGAVGSDDNSQRATAGVGNRQPSDESDDEGSSADGDGPGVTGDDGSSPLSPGTTVAGNLQPAGPTTSVASSGSSSSTGPTPTSSPTGSTIVTTATTRSTATTRPTSTARLSTTSTGRPSSSTALPSTTATSTTSTAPTTTPTTTATTTPTTASTTTTTTTTTTITTLPRRLIARPAQGATRRWDRAVTFQANDVPGATRYCWTLSGTGGEVQRCRDGTSYRLPARRQRPGAGSVTVLAQALSESGAVLMTQQIVIELVDD